MRIVIALLAGIFQTEAAVLARGAVNMLIALGRLLIAAYLT